MSVVLWREANDLVSPIRKKISESINDSKYPLMKKKGINMRGNMEIQTLLRELVMLNDKVESVQVLEYLAYNDVSQTLLRVPTEKFSKGSVCQECDPDWLD
jgi:DNA integrity scanning protein DisA with diadenylate cyclase activity